MSSRIYDCISRISDTITENKDFLTDLDREIGDHDARGEAPGLHLAAPFLQLFGKGLGEVGDGPFAGAVEV